MNGTPDTRRWTAAALALATALGWLMVLPPAALLAARAVSALCALAPELAETGFGAVTARSASSFWHAGLRTAAVAGVSAATAMLFAVPASFAIAKIESAASRAGWGVALALSGIPLYVTVSGAVRMFSLAWLVNPGSPGRTLLAAGLIGGAGLAPLATVAASAAWLSIPAESEEAGLLVTTPSRVWRRITLPLGAGGLAAAGVLAAVLAACDMTAPDALGVRTWAEELYLAFNLDSDPGKAAVSALPLAFISMAGLGVLLWRCAGMSGSSLVDQGRRARRYAPGRYHFAVAALLSVAAAVLAWPFADLLLAGLSESGDRVAWREASRAAAITVACSGAGSGLAVFLAIPPAYAASRSRSRLVVCGIAGAALLCVSLPTPLFGYAIASFWNRAWWNAPALSWLPGIFYDTPLSVVALYATQTLPPAVLMLWAVFRGIPAAALDAAATASVRPFAVFVRIVLPLVRNGCLLAWAVCYLLSLRELGGLLLTAPPGWTFLAVRYATQIHFGVYADLAFLLAVSLPLVLLPPLVLVCHISRRTARNTERVEP